MSSEINQTRVVKSRSRRQVQNAKSKIQIYTLVCSVFSLGRPNEVKWFVFEFIDDCKGGYRFRSLEDDKFTLGHTISRTNNGSKNELITRNWLNPAICCKADNSLIKPGWTVYNGKLYCIEKSEVKSGPSYQVASFDLLPNQNSTTPSHQWLPGVTGHAWPIGNKIYVFGLISATLKDVQDTCCAVYDPESDQWTSLPSPNRNGNPLFARRCFFSAAAVDGGTGSYVFVGSSYDRDIHKYDVSKNEWISYGFGHHLPSCCRGHITAVGSFLYWFSLECFSFVAYDVANKVVFDSGWNLDGLDIDYLMNGPQLQSPKLLHVANDRFCFMYTEPSSNMKPFKPLPPFILHCVILSLSVVEDNKTLKVSLISRYSYVVGAQDFLHGILLNCCGAVKIFDWNSIMSPQINNMRAGKGKGKLRRKRQDAKSQNDESGDEIYSIVCATYHGGRTGSSDVKWFVFEIINGSKRCRFRTLEDQCDKKLSLGSGNSLTSKSDIITKKNWLSPVVSCKAHDSLYKPGWTVYNGKLYCFSRGEVKSGPSFYPSNQVASIHLLLSNENPSNTTTPSDQWLPCNPWSFASGMSGHVWAIGNKIYVFGQVTPRQLNVPSQKAIWCEVYDPESDQWTSLPSPNRNGKPCISWYGSRFFTAAAVEEQDLPEGGIGTYSCIFVGSSYDGDIHKYDVANNEWVSYGFRHRLPLCCHGHIAAVGSILYWFSLVKFRFLAYDVANKVMFDGGPMPDGLCLDSLIKDPEDEIVKLLHVSNDRFCFVYLEPGAIRTESDSPPFVLSVLHCFIVCLSIAEDNETLKVSLISRQSYVVDTDCFLHGILLKGKLESKG